MTVRTRFAPSPTGSLHVGGARTALYCLLHARREGGRFLLRIEDTDQIRSTEEAAAGLLRDLTWLGLGWDEGPGHDAGTGPYFQSQRLPIYDRYIEELLAADVAYEAWDTPAELDALRKEAEAAKTSFRYRRQRYTPAQVAAFQLEGRKPVIRLQAPSHAVHIEDDILGTVTVAVDELEDIVIRKADGFPTYHFAVVIDDHLMGVTQILRGQEHLMNTPKHLGIYEALGWTPPRHGHLPLIFNPTGSKMSKRDKAKAARQAALDQQKARGAQGWAWLAELCGRSLDEVAGFADRKHDGVSTAEAIAQALEVELPMIEVMDFRRGGYLPAALLNYLALLGWSPGGDREIMSVDEMIAAFTIPDINKTAARFDAAKLAWMNGEYLRRLTLDELVAAFRGWLEVAPASRFHGMDEDRLRAFLAVYQPRMSTLAELDKLARFYFVAPSAWDADAVKKHLAKGDGFAQLRAAGEALAGCAEWTPAGIEACLNALAAARGVGVGKVAQPVRVAVSGTGVSPPIGDTLALLGKTDTLARIDACLAAHPG